MLTGRQIPTRLFNIPGRRVPKETLAVAISKGGLFLACLAALSLQNTGAAAPRPNIIYIMADDLGYGDLGSYGQTVIETPNIDRLAAQGIRFTDHYSGHTVCRPSRLVLLTGRHSGNTAISSNAPYTLPTGARTVTTLLKQAGYATGGVGKWALGRPETSGRPTNQGFDFWFGYLDQGEAHNYYPEMLWKNDESIRLPGNKVGDQKRVSVQRETYSHDLLTEHALQFIRANRDQPFFLQAHYTIPHANNEGGRATGDGSEVPEYGVYSDRDWPYPEKGFAAMITRLDGDIGRMIALLKELGIDDNTVVFFTSDNGPHQEGGHQMEYFNSNGSLRGYKRDLYEGGIRVPMIARWPGKIRAGTTTDHPSAFWDFLPTACALAEIDFPNDIDGISYLPTLLGSDQPRHEFLYWQFSGKVAVRTDHWKAVRPGEDEPYELYDLSNDIGEQQNIAQDHSDVLEKLKGIAGQYEWTSLIDDTLARWRGYRQTEVPASGWSLDGGILHCDGTARVDLITKQQYENYELVVEWKTEPDGNSGILLHADESTDKIAFNAPEIQIYATGQRDPGLDHQAGALYALYPAIESTILPPEEWNTTRVVSDHGKLTVWHNGIQVCDTQVGGEEWNTKVAAGKFANAPQFGTRTKGHIGLQDHGKQTWFRSVRIRERD